MKFKELITRYILFIFAASLVGSGIAIITSSSIGTTPISSATYEVSLHSGLSLGTVTFLFNFLLVVLQALIIPRNQVKANLLNFALQIFITFIFSIAIDLVMMLIRHLFTISDLPYWGCAVFLLTGIAVMAVGICLEIIANVVMVPGEAFVKVVSQRLNKPFSLIKTILDITLVTIAIILTLIFTGTVFESVREGTIVAALITGPLVHLFMPHLQWIETVMQKIYKK